MTLPERTNRALQEDMRVIQVDSNLFMVESSSGNWYNVDLEQLECECPDHQHRGVICKHMRRAALDSAKGDVEDAC